MPNIDTMRDCVNGVQHDSPPPYPHTPEGQCRECGVRPETDTLAERLRRAVKRLEEKRDERGTGLFEKARLEGKIEGVKLAASYLEEGTRIFPAPAPVEDPYPEHA